MKVGIVGFGSFGQFAARVLHEYAEVFVWSEPSIRSDYASTVEFAALRNMDVVILAVPLDAYEAVLIHLRPLLLPGTVVVDICSVKVYSRDIMLRILKGHENMLITHPLFGPESATDGTAGHGIVVTDVIGSRAEKCLAFCADVLGLNITRISAEEHDRVMAYVHVLTFFVARGLGSMHMPEIPFKTPSFNELMDLVRLDKKHSDDLFMTVQCGNPYGDEVRQEFMQTLHTLEKSIAP